MIFEIKNNSLYFTRAGEVGRLSACANHSIRFEASPLGLLNDENWTIIPKNVASKVWLEGKNAYLSTGNLTAKMYENGRMEYYSNDMLILSEKCDLTFSQGIRNYHNTSGDSWSSWVNFAPNPEEHFYGLGHEANGCFDLKGCTIDLRHVNTKCTIPYLYSSLGYGFIWNMPSTGTCQMGHNRTRWTSDSMKKMDYVVIAGNPKEVTRTLTDLTGHAPIMPDWAMGFWQSRLRYETQEEVLEVARRYYKEGIPVSVIVIDYFHWTEQGDYKFDPKYWPDPKAMADELHSMGMKLMVSMWPTINEKSENYHTMLQNNMLIRTTRSSNRIFDFYGPQAMIDPTNPATRDYVWNKLKENYIDNGVDCLWFDEAEPEIHPEHFDNLILHAGKGEEVGLLYPYYYAQLVYDGMKKMGRDDIITLSRCAYLGAQRFGTLVWSGDIPSTFESLSEQIKSGLNMSMCGIPWWTTDIGGFYGGDTQSDYFRELIVRWFQYGVFSPVTRIHGSRNGHDRSRDIIEPSGGHNELWSFGERNYDILKELVLLRDRLQPYIKKHMDIASTQGIPMMRPMFFDYPDDSICYELGEQFLFGDDIIFAPITQKGETLKKVYLPTGRWILTKNNEIFIGDTWYTISARLDEFIAFVKEGADVLEAFNL